MSAQPATKKVRTWGLGAVESAIVEIVRARGQVTPLELDVEHGGEFQNPQRVLARLADHGLLVKKERGVYTLPTPHRDRIAALRAKAPVVKRGDHTAPNSLPLTEGRGKILKGAHLVLGDRAALPGDVVLVIIGSTRILRRFVREVAGRGKARAEAAVFSDGTSNHVVSLTAHDEIVIKPVVGFYSRRTERAAKLRAEANPPV